MKHDAHSLRITDSGDWRFRQTVVQAVVFVLAIISGVMSFDGTYLLNARAGGQGFSTVALASLTAIGVTSAIICAWWIMMQVLPGLRQAWRICAGLILVLLLQGWMLAVSSSSNIISLGINEALVIHMDRTLTQYETAASARIARALAVKPRLGGLQGEAEGRCLQAEGERTSGTLTNAPGEGSVTSMLDLLCAQSSAVVQALATSVEAVETRADEIQALLEQANAVIWDTSRPVFDREQAFLTRIGEIKAWLRVSAADDLASTLRASHQIQAASLTPASLANGAFGQKQLALIATLRAGVEETGKIYHAMAAEIDALEIPPLPKSVRISLKQAVWDARSDLAIQYAQAIGIDVFQLFMVLAFMLGRRHSAR